jgi:hypothetical protein
MSTHGRRITTRSLLVVTQNTIHYTTIHLSTCYSRSVSLLAPGGRSHTIVLQLPMVVATTTLFLVQCVNSSCHDAFHYLGPSKHSTSSVVVSFESRRRVILTVRAINDGITVRPIIEKAVYTIFILPMCESTWRPSCYCT